MAISAEYRLKFAAFTRNGDVSIQVKHSHWDKKNQTNKTLIYVNIVIYATNQGLLSLF